MHVSRQNLQIVGHSRPLKLHIKVMSYAVLHFYLAWMVYLHKGIISWEGWLCCIFAKLVTYQKLNECAQWTSSRFLIKSNKSVNVTWNTLPCCNLFIPYIHVLKFCSYVYFVLSTASLPQYHVTRHIFWNVKLIFFPYSKHLK